MAAPYHRVPLMADGNMFRMFQLDFGQDEDQLKGSLVLARQTERPTYEALSYTWGDSSLLPGHVIVDGETVEIPANLEVFLKELRCSDKVRVLYADAICIGQQDNQEKGFQVQMMHKIYESATRVLSWLGPGSLGTEVFFKRAITTVGYDPSSTIGSEPVWELLMETLATDIVGLSYWKRAWIIQECLHADNIVFYCGSMNVTWEQFMNLHDMVTSHTPGLEYTEGPSNLSDELEGAVGPTKLNLLAGQRATKPVSISTVTRTFCSLESTDPRDMVYAFLGLMREAELTYGKRIVSDYEISAIDLYFCVGDAYLGYPRGVLGQPGRVLGNLRMMLRINDNDLLEAVCAVIDPDELFVGIATSEIAGRPDRASIAGYREGRRIPDGLGVYEEALGVDFATIVRLRTAA